MISGNDDTLDEENIACRGLCRSRSLGTSKPISPATHG